MMKKKKIWICDDRTLDEQPWKEKLEAVPTLLETFDVHVATPHDLVKKAQALEKRRRDARGRDNLIESYAEAEPIDIFDEADILIIDYDLIRLKTELYLTGENIAYLARCYSRCGLIVALNQFEHVAAFDLTLKRHPESFADLNISDQSLDNPGLWCESSAWNEFRPWYWPYLPEALEKFERRIKNLRSSLDESILDYLGFLKSDTSLPRSAIEFLTIADKPSETTFQDFVLSSGSRSPGNGLRRKDKPFSKEAIMRIAAARVAHWLENIVLPGQDILVDAPHLVSRYSSLINGDSKDLNAWNNTASLASYEDIGVEDNAIQHYRFAKQDWLSRPSWFWAEVSNCEDIKEVADPWSAERTDYVFCEDTSRFALRDKTREFLAPLESPFVRRFAKVVEGVSYRPRVRFSM